MELRLEMHQGIAVITVVGSVDGTSVDRFTISLKKALENPVHSVILDLSQLRMIVSSGISAFIMAQQTCATRGGQVHLAKPTGSVAEVFRMLGLSAIFPVHDSVATALVAANKERPN